MHVIETNPTKFYLLNRWKDVKMYQTVAVSLKYSKQLMPSENWQKFMHFGTLNHLTVNRPGVFIFIRIRLHFALFVLL